MQQNKLGIKILFSSGSVCVIKEYVWFLCYALEKFGSLVYSFLGLSGTEKKNALAQYFKWPQTQFLNNFMAVMKHHFIFSS